MKHRTTVAAAAFLGAMLAVPAIAAEKTVIVAMGSDNTTLDPHKISAGGDGQFFSNVFESLYGHNVDGSLMPQLATGYKISEDGLTYEFALRKGVTFHNGEAFTADDVRFSWQRGIDPEIKNPRATALLNNVRDVEIVDDFTVRLHLKKRDVSILENLGEYFYIVPADTVRKVGNDAFGKQPIGTGPYHLRSRKIKESMEFDAFKQHYARVPGVDKLVMKIVPDAQTRVAMLQTGEADIINSVPPHMAKQIQASPDTKIIEAASYQNIFISTSEKRQDGTWKNQKVRQALNYAVDKKAIIDKVMFGFATQSAAPCHIKVNGCDIGKEPYPYDPKKAKALLEEGKFDFNRTYRFVGVVPGRTPQSKDVVEAIAFYLGQVGIKTKVEILEFGAWVAYIQSKEYDTGDLLFWTWTDYSNDPIARINRAVSATSPLAWTSRPELEKKIAEANTILDEAKRKEALREIFTELYEDPPWINLWTVKDIYGARRNIEWTPRVAISWPDLWKLSKN